MSIWIWLGSIFAMVAVMIAVYWYVDKDDVAKH